MNEVQSECPRLPIAAGGRDCIRWLRAVTYWVGPGFHPDTPAGDYVKSDDSPSFDVAVCKRLDADLDRCFDVLESLGRDPYAIAVKPQKRMLKPMFQACSDQTPLEEWRQRRSQA